MQRNPAGDVILRAAEPRDSAALAILLDAASRRLASWFWSSFAEPGRSYAEIGRERVLSNTESPSHFTKWWVADAGGTVAGGINSYGLPDSCDGGDHALYPEPFKPIAELEAIAAGSWFIQAVAVFPEFRGQGLGRSLIGNADALARTAGSGSLAIMVETANPGAHRLYTSLGFSERARRPYVAFPGSDDAGEWILLGRKTR